MLNTAELLKRGHLGQEFSMMVNLIENTLGQLQSGEEASEQDAVNFIHTNIADQAFSIAPSDTKMATEYFSMIGELHSAIEAAKLDHTRLYAIPQSLQLALPDLGNYYVQTLVDLATNETDPVLRSRYILQVAAISYLNRGLDDQFATMSPIAQAIIYNFFILPSIDDLTGAELEEYLEREAQENKAKTAIKTIQAKIRDFDPKRSLIQFRKTKLNADEIVAKEDGLTKVANLIDRLLDLFKEDKKEALNLIKQLLSRANNPLGRAYASEPFVRSVLRNANKSSLDELNIHEAIYYYIAANQVKLAENAGTSFHEPEVVFEKLGSSVLFKLSQFGALFKAESRDDHTYGEDAIKLNAQKVAREIVENFSVIGKNAELAKPGRKGEAKTPPYQLMHQLLDEMHEKAGKTTDIVAALHKMAEGSNRPNDLMYLLLSIFAHIALQKKPMLQKLSVEQHKEFMRYVISNLPSNEI